MADSDFDVSWRAFAESDARIEAPSRVRDAVMAAWDEASEAVPPSPRRYRHIWTTAAALAAALVLATGLALLRDRGERHDRTPAPRTVAENRPEVVPNPSSDPPATAAPKRRATASDVALSGVAQPFRAAGERPARRTARARSGAATPLLRLAADPTFEAEPLQLVRLRMARADLEMFGVALLEPDTSGLVDVDVVVGGDGLPRDIRRIRPVLETHGEMQ
jgi:hypothetical protein